MRWTLINTYTHPMDAQTDILLLESEGIECRLDNAQTITVDPLLSQAIGGAKLWVPEGDSIRATELLQGALALRKQAHPDEYLSHNDPDWARWLTRGLLIVAVIIILLVVVIIGR